MNRDVQTESVSKSAVVFEARLPESEERFRTIADCAPVLIWISGLDKLCTFFNKPWLDFTGRTMEEEVGNGWAEGVHPGDLEECLRIYVEAFDARRAFVMEYRLKHRDGEYRWIIDKGVLQYDAGGNFTGYIGSCMDISRQKRAEEKLRQTLAEMQQLRDQLQHENLHLRAENRGGIG